jgi:hypothetical protein
MKSGSDSRARRSARWNLDSQHLPQTVRAEADANKFSHNQGRLALIVADRILENTVSSALQSRRKILRFVSPLESR